MDNQIFNVNGSDKGMLISTLKLLFTQKSHSGALGWSINPKKGMILYWYVDDNMNNINKFPVHLGPETLADIIYEWLSSDFHTIELSGWDVDMDHDGSNGKGWRVYVEDWGHVDNNDYAICAITPAWMWYGK